MTADRPAPGLVVHQPERGFRYGSESFWCVGMALQGGVPATAIDLGTGSGIMALLLARHGVQVRGVDVRPEWRPLWERTLAESDVAASLQVQDVRDVAGSTDLVVSNPPYFPLQSGPPSRDPFKGTARSELAGTLDDFVEAAQRCLSPRGRAVFVVPADRYDAFARTHPRRVAWVGRRRVLVEFAAKPCAKPEIMRVEEQSPAVARWYALAREA